jgi:hypothetical protein
MQHLHSPFSQQIEEARCERWRHHDRSGLTALRGDGDTACQRAPDRDSCSVEDLAPAAPAESSSLCLLTRIVFEKVVPSAIVAIEAHNCEISEHRRACKDAILLKGPNANCLDTQTAASRAGGSSMVASAAALSAHAPVTTDPFVCGGSSHFLGLPGAEGGWYTGVGTPSAPAQVMPLSIRLAQPVTGSARRRPMLALEGGRRHTAEPIG